MARGANGGPKTQQGKAKASANALKHGLFSHAPIIPGLESLDDWQRHLDGIVASLQPEGQLETVLAERIAFLLWRLNRATRFETEMIAVHLDDAEDDMVTAARYGKALGIPLTESITPEKVDNAISRRILPSDDTLNKVMRYETHLHRQFTQTLHELEALQARRKGERSSLTRFDFSVSPGT